MDNRLDMVAKKRDLKPDGSHFNAKLTTDQVKEIIESCKDKTSTQTAIARKFNVSDATVSSIISGKRWRGRITV